MLKKSLILMMSMIFIELGVQAESGPLSQIFREVKPSVVVVRTVRTDISSDPRDIFVSSSGLGSGVIISKDGLVMTAAHVIQTADAVSIETPDHKLIPAKIVASAPIADVALLQLEELPGEVVVAKIADSDTVEVGDKIFIVGAPYGLSYTLTSGIISARHQSSKMMEGMTEVELFQTDAAVNSGNSGGPMFNMNGEVIGIVSHILSRSGGFEGLGFAVTSNVAQKMLMEQKSFWSGVEGIILSGPMAEVFNVPQPCGFLLQRVADNSPASRMGLKGGHIEIQIMDQKLIAGGDIILEVAGMQVDQDNIKHNRLQETLSKLHPGKSVSVKLLRAGQIMELTLTLEEK